MTTPNKRQPGILHTRWRMRGTIVLLAIAIVLGAWLYRDNPQQLLQQARSISKSSPSRADELLERSVLAAGGQFPEAQLERSVLFAEQHLWLESLGCFSQIAQPRECDPAALLHLAELALADRSEYLAELSLEAARRPGPREADVLRLVIPLNDRNGKTENLLRDCSRLIELDSTDPLPWLVAGRIYDKRRDVTKALDAFQKARALNLDLTNLNEVRNDMAELYLHEGNLIAAREQLAQLQTVRSPTSSDRLKWAYLLRLEGDLSKALQETELVVQQMPDNLAAIELRGILKLDLDQPKEAVVDLKRVLERHPGSVEAHSKIGQAYQRMNQLEQASKHFNRSRELVEMRAKLAEVLNQLQQDPKNSSLQDQSYELRKAIGE